MKEILTIIIILQLVPGISQEAHLIIPKGHLESITSVCCTSDGKYILSGSKDHTAILWDPVGLEVETFKLFHEVTAVAFSRDKQYVLTGSADGKIILWKFNGDSVLAIKAHTKPLTSIAFSQDDQLILSSSMDHTAKLWDLKGKLKQTFKQNKAINSAAFSSDGQSIITGGDDKTAILWNLKGLELRKYAGHDAAITQVHLSSDGKYLITSSADSTAAIWTMEGTKLQQVKHQERVISCDFSIDSETVASGSFDGIVKVWNIKGEVLHEIKAHKSGLTTMCFSPNGSALITGCMDKTLNMWDLKGHLLQHFQGHSHDIHSVSFSPDGNSILTGSGDHSAKLWDILNYRYQNFKGHKSKVISTVFSPDGKFVITGSKDKTAKIWDLKGKILQTLNHPEPVHSVVISPNGNLILTACHKDVVKLWNFSGKEIKLLKQKGIIKSAIFSPDGKSVIVTTHDSIVNHYDLSGKLIKKIKLHTHINCLILSPDGKFMITGNTNGHTQIWDFVTGENLKTLGQDTEEILSVAISSDGKLLASGSKEGRIELFDLENAKSTKLIGHTSKIFALNFSPERKFLVSASEDETTRLWAIESKKELACMISLDDTDWVVTTPKGLFDASPGAMEHMDYEVGFEAVELEQLKERYYEPGVLEEVFGMLETEFHDVPALKNIALYPELEAKLLKDELKINLKPRSGGIGKLSVFVNHKEVTEDANPNRKTELKIDLNAYSKYYFGDTNIITLRVYNEEGWLESHAHNFLYFPYEGSKGSESPGGAKQTTAFKGKPHLYALVVGTSDYSGENLDLKFPDLDAAAIAQGLLAVGSRLFEDRVHIRLLTTNANIPQDISSRANIEKTLKDYATKATPGDVVITYFSGHGTTYGQAEKNQFYYLTKDIASENLSDPEVRNNFTISSDDLTKWLTAIPAHKEVLIFDACHSGKAVEALSSLGAKDLSPSQIRALDRMKDRSGIFIISGSAADAVSYEASKYGQGLLTYSLLQGMSGLAVTEDKRVDLAQLFEYARDKVPEYAKSINKIQIPVVAFPKGGGSFDIGIVDSTVKIKLAQPKPVFIRNIFLDESTMSDHLDITHGLAEYFRTLTSNGSEAELIYVDVNEYENAYSIKGLYSVKGTSVNLRSRLFLGKNSVGEFQLTGDKTDIQGLIGSIVEKVSSLVVK